MYPICDRIVIQHYVRNKRARRRESISYSDIREIFNWIWFEFESRSQSHTAYERCKFAIEIPIYSLLIPIHRIRFASLRFQFNKKHTDRTKTIFFQLISIETVTSQARVWLPIREWNDSDKCMKLYSNEWMYVSWLKLINKNFRVNAEMTNWKIII